MNHSYIKSISVLALAACALPVAARAQLIISEVHPTGSSASYLADWFELSNIGGTTINLTGWRMDDNSFLFANSVALRNVTSIAPGQSIIFLEGNASGSNDGTVNANFTSAWFGGSVPAGLTLANYGGSGVGLSSGGDGVALYDSVGALMAKVSFGAATLGVTFDNAAGLNDTTISLLSAVGVNNAFQSYSGGEIGSPGVVPEPSMLVLAMLGGLSLFFRRALRA